MKSLNKKILVYLPSTIKHFKNWEFYKPDIDAIKDFAQVKKVYSIFNFLKNFLNYDVVYCFWWVRSFPVILISKIFRKKVICTGAIHFHDLSGEKTWFNSSFLYKLLNYISLKLSDKNLFVSYQQLIEFKRYLNINNGYLIKLKVNKNIKISKNVYKKTDKKKLLILSTILWHTKSSHKRKGLYETIQAVELLKKKKINFKFYIIGGKGNGLSELYKIIKKKDLIEHIKVLVDCNFIRKSQILKETHLYLQPSYSEAFSYAVLEASAFNTLSLIYKKGPQKEITSTYCFKVKEIKPFLIYREILNYYMLDDNKETILRTKLKKHIEDKYNFNLHKKEWKNLIKSL